MLSLLFILCLFALFRLWMEVIFKYFNKNQPNYSRTDWSNIRYDFQTSLLSLIAYMMKADGHPRKVELEFVRPHLYRILGDTQAPRALLQLRELLKNNINFYEVTQVINHSLDETSKCNILSILYGIAMADGTMTAEEWQMLVRITEYIGLSRRDLETIRMMYGNNSYGYNGQSYQSNINTSYEILGISPSATNEEVKRAYRTLVKKFHPDMLANLSKEAQEDAQKRFVKIQEAYEKICEARGIK